jgi:hypothetical protein
MNSDYFDYLQISLMVRACTSLNDVKYADIDFNANARCLLRFLIDQSLVM